jgi:hypothetical protein
MSTINIHAHYYENHLPKIQDFLDVTLSSLVNKQSYNLSEVCGSSIFRVKPLKKSPYKKCYFFFIICMDAKIHLCTGKKTKTENIPNLRNDSGYMIATAESQWS